MNERVEIRVRAMKAADWRDLYEIWIGPRTRLSQQAQSRDFGGIL
jgi:hypothetical protein